MLQKNRNREKYSFANINLLGNCNANCYFCLGKDIQNELKNKNHLKINFNGWKDFDTFLDVCKKHNIKKLFLTGQTADGLQYEYLSELLDFLQEENNFEVGLRSNGYLAIKKQDILKKFKGEIGYSIQSLDPISNKSIMGRKDIPDWNSIIPLSGDNVRISIVINRFNYKECLDIIDFLSKYENVKYIQLRRISTDTRFDLLKEDIEIFENFHDHVKKTYELVDMFSLAEIYKISNKNVSIWKTIETSSNSLNYFTDGTISEEYFIVEGYLKNNLKV